MSKTIGTKDQRIDNAMTLIIDVEKRAQSLQPH